MICRLKEWRILMNIDGMTSTVIPTLDREKFDDVRDQTRLVKSLLIVVSFITHSISDFSFYNLPNDG